MQPITKSVFVASSSSKDIIDDRQALADFILKTGIEYQRFGIQLTLNTWELQSIRFEASKKQDSYTKHLRESDVVVFLLGSYFGKYTEEEFEEAIRLVQNPDKNRSILVYFKDVTVSSLSMTGKDIDSLKRVIELKRRIRDDLKQVYGTYSNHDELLLKFESELNRELLPILAGLDIGRISTPADCHLADIEGESITSIDMACNSGKNAVQKNRSFLKKAYTKGASIRIMINDPSLPIFNGTSTFSTAQCRDNAGQPTHTKEALEHLNNIILSSDDAKGSIEVKIAQFAITGQLIIINKRHVNYIPYIPNIPIGDLFKVEFSGDSSLVNNLEASFSDAWDDLEKTQKLPIDINNKDEIKKLFKEWQRIKREQEKQTDWRFLAGSNVVLKSEQHDS